MQAAGKIEFSFIVFASILLACILSAPGTDEHLFKGARLAKIAHQLELYEYTEVKDTNSIPDLLEYLTKHPDSPYRQSVENQIKALEMAAVRTHKQAAYEVEALTALYREDPLYNADIRVTTLSKLSYQDIAAQVEAHYERFKDRTGLVNPELERLHKFAVSYDLISRLRFCREVTHLKGQKEIDDLIDHIIQSRWYAEFMVRITENQAYGYMENQALQILISIHTAAHFFEIPYPTLFCLLFQESKFDFKISSHTGAAGLGQLTRIALKQIGILRQKASYEDRLQAACRHLGHIYKDPFVLRLLREMGFDPVFPEMTRFPLEVEIKKPKALDGDIIRATQKELALRGYPVKLDFYTLKNLLAKVRRGIILPERYAPLHPAYAKVIEREYGKQLGNIYNPETNILYSAMLLRFYINYQWKINGTKLHLRPNVKAITAVVAYNEGSKGVISYFERLSQEFPRLNLSRATLAQLETTFTQERVLENHPKAPQKAKEIFKHAWEVKTCSCID